jgi:hypothetical protein
VEREAEAPRPQWLQQQLRHEALLPRLLRRRQLPRRQRLKPVRLLHEERVALEVRRLPPPVRMPDVAPRQEPRPQCPRFLARNPQQLRPQHRVREARVGRRLQPRKMLT